MKKIILLLIVGMVILGGLGAAAVKTDLSSKKTMVTKSDSTSIPFSSHPVVLEKDGFVNIKVNGETTQLIVPNKPALPIYVKTYLVPFGSKNIKVTCVPKDIGTMALTKEVMPVRVAPLSKSNEMKAMVKDTAVYSSAELYPNTWYSYDIGAGRDYNDQEVLFVKVVCYPVRYSPANNQIDYAGSFDVSITYDAPTTQPTTVATYDLVIIAPKAFEAKLQPLIDAKNTHGMKTTFMSVEDIFSQYTGADPPEQVKYFIKYAYDTWGIKYALLVGGLKSHLFGNDKDARSYGSKAWWVPVRYVSIPQDSDIGVLSDLYYGCLYNATGGFDSWDSNHDGVYAAWGAGAGIPNDKFDMNPEVFVGRLPVVNKMEVGIMVKKIIQYESTGPDAKPWYKNFVGVGGKTFDFYEGKPDGEYLCDLAFNYTKNAIPDLNQVRVYSSNRNTTGLVPNAKGIQKAVSAGAGFVDFEGHGNPLVWDTIWFDGTYPNDWVGGINLYQFLKFSNGEKLPVVIVGGCHNGMYNVTTLGSMLDRAGTRYYCYGLPAPACFSWGLVLKHPGGAIASTGDTGFGMGYQGKPVSLSAELESNFFFEIGNGTTNLASAHSLAIQKFIAEEEVGQLEAFCITNWALLGDPSLKLGGYSS